MQLAQMVQTQVGEHVKLVVKPTNDPRSYHVSSRKIQRELGFTPQWPLKRAIADYVSGLQAHGAYSAAD